MGLATGHIKTGAAPSLPGIRTCQSLCLCGAVCLLPSMLYVSRHPGITPSADEQPCASATEVSMQAWALSRPAPAHCGLLPAQARPAEGERLAKYNQLLRIEEELGGESQLRWGVVPLCAMGDIGSTASLCQVHMQPLSAESARACQ